MPSPTCFADRHAPVVHALNVLRPMARRWTRTTADADDLVQDTAERALKNFDRYHCGTNAVAWVRSIMYHLAVDGSRRRGCRPTTPFDEALVATTEPPEVVDRDSRWREVEWDEIDRLVDELAAPVAATFRLWLGERLSYTEISRRQGIPLGTVSSRLMRGRLALRASVERARTDGSRHGPARAAPSRLPDAA
jgi:RNA polymerase sigma-70 factor (ECF subfamily)